MSYAPQNQTPDITDAIDGSITSWYDNINNCLKTSECVPGHYEYAQAPSYGNQCPVQEGGSTKIDIGCNRFEIVDLNNSYIECEFTAPVTIPAQYDSGVEAEDTPVDIGNDYYIGFKSAFDVIDQYRIYSNGDLIYTQNHACYESFLNNISLTDSAKEKSPCYATYRKILANDTNVPGAYITTDNDDVLQVEVNIKMKIPLNMFPVLQNLKYFPGFMGKLSIEIYPSYKNLVVAPITHIGEDYTQEMNFDDMYTKLWCTGNEAGVALNTAEEPEDMPDAVPIQYERIRGGSTFVQINTRASNLTIKHTEHVEADEEEDIEAHDETSYSLREQTFGCSASTLNKFHLYQAVYMIKMDVYNSLEMNNVT